MYEVGRGGGRRGGGGLIFVGDANFDMPFHGRGRKMKTIYDFFSPPTILNGTALSVKHELELYYK